MLASMESDLSDFWLMIPIAGSFNRTPSMVFIMLWRASLTISDTTPWGKRLDTLRPWALYSRCLSGYTPRNPMIDSHSKCRDSQNLCHRSGESSVTYFFAQVSDEHWCRKSNGHNKSAMVLEETVRADEMQGTRRISDAKADAVPPTFKNISGY